MLDPPDELVDVREWGGHRPVTEAEILNRFREEGLMPSRWSNGPGDVYAAHQHTYHKVITVLAGSIVFGLTEAGHQLVLGAGDRLDLPAGVVHDAVVGPDGVTCFEAHR